MVDVNVLFVIVAGEGKKVEKHLCNGTAMWGKNRILILVHYLHELRV